MSVSVRSVRRRLPAEDTRGPHLSANAICATCRQAVAIDKAGCFVPHHRRDSPFQCYASGMPASEALATRSKRSTVPGRAFRAKRFTAPAPSFLEPPVWLPTWDGQHLPSIALPATGPVGIWLPRRTNWEHEARIIDYAGSPPEWNGHRGCWTVPNRRFLHLTGQLLARNQRIVVGREFNPREACTSSCKNARLPYCTCSCRAKYHGGGRWMAGWSILDEVDTEHQGQSWHWIVVTLAR